MPFYVVGMADWLSNLVVGSEGVVGGENAGVEGGGARGGRRGAEHEGRVVSVVLVETGLANTASVAAALHRAGATVTRSADPEAIRRAERVVLPGVGHYGVFSGRRWQTQIYPRVREMIHDMH